MKRVIIFIIMLIIISIPLFADFLNFEQILNRCIIDTSLSGKFYNADQCFNLIFDENANALRVRLDSMRTLEIGDTLFFQENADSNFAIYKHSGDTLAFSYKVAGVWSDVITFNSSGGIIADSSSFAGLTVNGCVFDISANSNIDANGYSVYFGNEIGINELYCSGFGYRALNGNTKTSCSAFGYNALYGNTGASCSGFGRDVLMNNTGNDAFAFGYRALYGNSGINASAFGKEALYNNSGISPNAFGWQALLENTGDYCSAFGYQTLTGNTQNNNSAFGSYAFTSNTTLSNSTALGYNAEPDASNQVMLGDTLVTEVKTAGGYTGASLDTGQGAYELYAMNQDVENTDDVIYNSVSLTKELEFDSTPNVDSTASGIKADMIFGEAITFSQTLYQKSDGELYKADADTVITMPIIALALESGGDGQTKKVLFQGFIRNDAWTWTVGGLIYGSCTTGELTQTKPTGANDQVQIVGFATHADRMYFNPNLMLIEIGA